MKYLFLLLTFVQCAFAFESAKKEEEFRNYDEKESVREFYRVNHIHQTLDFVLQKKRHFAEREKVEMGIWEAIELLDTLVDESDPDLDLPQSQHLFQTAEAMRKDGQPRWMILTGLIHDLGKILAIFGEEQWSTVGDTFPVGCKYSDKIIFSEFFKENPDYYNPLYQMENGIYEPGCGFDNVHLSWGHDEYLYQVVKDYLPEEALCMIRYHSFYPFHKEGAYQHLASDKDREMLPWILTFNKYDLYSKERKPVDVASVEGYYKELIAEFFPEKLRW